MEALRELKDLFCNHTPSPDTLRRTFRKWKRGAALGIGFIDEFSEEDEESPWSMRGDECEDNITILRFLTYFELHHLHRGKGFATPTTDDLIASIARISYRCSGGQGWRKRMARLRRIMKRCYNVDTLHVGPIYEQPAFFDPLWVANRIMRDWMEGSSKALDTDDEGDDQSDEGDDGGEHVSNVAATDKEGNRTLNRKKSVPSAAQKVAIGRNVTIGDVVHLYVSPNRDVDVGSTTLNGTRVDSNDSELNFVATVATCLRDNTIRQFHMQR